MELIYLWIEKYKNIENQGFNLSYKFKCEYNFETNELKIEENKDYINIFPENINVMAIVGKNGSGKSNLVKALFELFYMYYFRNETNMFLENKYNNALDVFIKSSLIDLVEKDNEFFLIIKNKNEIFKIDGEYIKKLFQKNGLHKSSLQNKLHYEFNLFYKNKLIKNFNEDCDNFSIYYNYSLDSWQDEKSEWVETIYHRKDDYKIPLLLEPYKKGNTINLNLLRDLTNQRILMFYSFLKKQLVNQKITSFFNPNKIKFKYAISETIYKDELKKKEIKEGLNAEFIPYKILIKYINLKKLSLHNEESFLPSYEIKEIIERFYQNDDYKILNLLYLLFKMIEKKEKLKIFNSQINSFEEKLKKVKFKAEFNELVEEFEEFVNECGEELSNFDKNDYKIKKIIVALNFHNKKLYEHLPKDTTEIQINILPDTNDIIDSFPGWIKVDFYENNKALSSLSSGEKFKFQFLIGFLYQLSNLTTEKYTSINIFMDEIEMGFHPEWQKNFLKETLDTLKNFKNITKFDKKLNLYFLTHSPFLISDLPKQNIIFLDKDENGKCKVVDELNEKKETFGANIHTLLSDSFFMEDGLIGKFAEKKINEVIRYLNGKDSEIKTDEEAQKIINIIGEPIIKKELQRILDSKRLEKVKEIDEIKKEIEKLQKKLEILENEKNNNN